MAGVPTPELTWIFLSQIGPHRHLILLRGRIALSRSWLSQILTTMNCGLLGEREKGRGLLRIGPGIILLVTDRLSLNSPKLEPHVRIKGYQIVSIETGRRQNKRIRWRLRNGKKE